MMNKMIFNRSFLNAPFGYALYKIIIDESGKPADYEFIEINFAFEKLSGLSSSNILNKNGSEVILNSDIEKIKLFSDVALNGVEKDFDYYSETLKSWFNVKVWSPEKYYFAAIYLAEQTLHNKIEFDSESSLLSIPTEKMMIEEKLENSLAQKKALLDAIPDMMFLFNQNGNIIDFKADDQSQLYLKPEQFLGKNCQEVLPPELAKITNEKIDEVLLNKKSAYSTYQLELNGELRHFESRYVACGIGEVLAIVRDITERVQYLDALKESEQKNKNLLELFRKIADNMPDMLWAKDIERRFIFVNKSLCENLLMAKDIDEPIGKTDMFFVNREREAHPDNYQWHTFGEICIDSDKAVTETGRTGRFNEFGNIQNKFLYLDVIKTPLRNENGEMIGTVGAARDVTVQKKIEADIIQRDILLDAIAKATSLLVLSENPEENIIGALEILGKATKSNRAYIFENGLAEILRLPTMNQRFEWNDSIVKPQIDNPELQNLLYKDSCPRWYDLLSKGEVIKGNVKDFPEVERRALSSQDIKSLLVAPVFINKEFWGFVGFDDCFNEREWSHIEEQLLAAAANTIGTAYIRKKNQEELVIAKEKAEESDKLKTAFLHNISHEIRTPLNGIQGFGQIMTQTNLSENDRLRYLGFLQISIDRLIQTITDYLDVSLLVTGSLKVIPKPFDLNYFLEDLFERIYKSGEKKGLVVSLKKPEFNQEIFINADKELLQKAIWHLLTNAVKFTHRGGIFIGYEIINNSIEIFIKDSGIGISNQAIERIFEPFYQEELSISRNYEGNGLGLTIAKGFIEKSGGVIRIESEKNRGTIFYVSLPWRNTKSNSIIEKSVNSKNIISKPLILVAEDERINYSIMELYLKSASYDILWALDGEEAVEKCHENENIALVLMDIKMPVLNGIEATKRIKKFRPDLPIIAVTAQAVTGDETTILEAGCNGYLSKPLIKNTLLNKIANCLNDLKTKNQELK